MALADYTFLDVMWTMIVFFAWIAWFFLLFRVFADVFRRHDLSGWGKAGWVVLVLVLPFLGVFIYLIVYSKGIAERDTRQTQAAQAQMDDYVRSVAGEGGGSAAEIARAKQLLDSGAISQDEFEKLKAKALA